ncbi:MAG: hypothetical protein IB618_02325 [Candidatus Pacearchaeota archaeon]|nr:MAG: hypothetical protein IB618_02325 [Candidatus Pacearchaeota archaeon]
MLGLEYLLSVLISTTPADKDQKDINEYLKNLNPWEKDSVEVVQEDSMDITFPAIDAITEEEPYYFFGNLGTPFNFKGAIGKETRFGKAKINALAYMDVGIDPNRGEVGGGIGSEYAGTRGAFNIGVNRGSLHTTDSTLMTQSTPYGRIAEQTISNQDDKKLKKFLGLSFGAGEKNKIYVGFGNKNTSEDVKDATSNHYDEIFHDVEQKNQNGVIITTETNLVTRVATDVRSIIKTDMNENRFLVQGSHDFGDLELGMATYLNNNRVRNTIDNRINTITNINGEIIVNVDVNGNVYVDTIPVSSHDKEYNRFVTRDFIDSNADLIGLWLKYGRKDKVNGVFDFEKGVFNSRDWSFRNRLNYMIKNKIVNSVDFSVNNTSIGGSLRFDLNMIPKDYIKQEKLPNPLKNLTNFYDHNREIDRRVDLSDKQKKILE